MKSFRIFFTVLALGALWLSLAHGQEPGSNQRVPGPDGVLNGISLGVAGLVAIDAGIQLSDLRSANGDVRMAIAYEELRNVRAVEGRLKEASGEIASLEKRLKETRDPVLAAGVRERLIKAESEREVIRQKLAPAYEKLFVKLEGSATATPKTFLGKVIQGLKNWIGFPVAGESVPLTLEKARRMQKLKLWLSAAAGLAVIGHMVGDNELQPDAKYEPKVPLDGTKTVRASAEAATAGDRPPSAGSDEDHRPAR